MSTFLAHPTIFAAYAAAAAGDPDLRTGTHLRLFPSSVIGFPLSPFAVWEIPAEPVRTLPFAWFDRDRKPLAQLDLDVAGGEAFGWQTAILPGEARLIGVEAQFPDESGEIAILDRSEDRLIAARSATRFQVGGPMVTRLRLRGRGPVDLRGWVVTPDIVFERIVGSPPFATMGLPLDGDAPWYTNGEGRTVAWDRVVAGAPRRWTRPDRPDGPFDPLTRPAEEARVTAFQPELDDHAQRLVQDPATPPASVVVIHEWPASMVAGVIQPWQQATVEVQNALLLKALDTGAGRYLGLMTLLRHLPEDQNPFGDSTAWLAAGAFACRRDRLPPPDTLEIRLIERLGELFPGLTRVIDRARQSRHLEIHAFVAPALAAPPPDLLPAPDVRLGPAQWLREKQGPSIRFRQQFLVKRPPLAALAALGRLEAGGWISRHEMMVLAPDAEPSTRAATRFLGSRNSLVDGRTGLVDDTEIPAAGAPWNYRLALSDVFGRFGAPAGISVPLPARPAIPVPALQAELHPAPRAAHNGPAAAGTVTFRIPVPAVEDLTAGSLPLAQAIITFDGVTKTAATPQVGGAINAEFNLPQLLAMESRRLDARAHFEDSEGNLGAEAVITVDIADPRVPEIPKTGIGIIWTSRPGPSEDVEFRLAFRGQAGARYRAYLTDARGLDIATVQAGRLRTRAEIAVDGANRGLAGLGMRDRFRLITEPPLEPHADGTVRLDARLPRSLETVQFLRFVPLSVRGSEAAFEACPLVPIAVPSDRRPPAPRVETQVDPVTGVARIKVVAEGLDLVALKAAEPGLFGEAPLGAAQPPSFRLRRASGVVPEAIYAREIARGPLALDGVAFTAEVVDSLPPGGLLPYVRYFYWAEVQMPPERRVPADVVEVAPPAGAILPTEARQREDALGAFSLTSPPAFAMRVPAEVPTFAAEAITATVRAGVGGMSYILEIRIEGGPIVHANGGTYKVRLYTQEDGKDLIAESTEAPLIGGQLSWSTERPALAVPQIRVAVVPIDPIGREGAPVFVEAVPA